MFKSALVYTMPEAVDISVEDLEEKLEEHRAHDIRRDQGRSIGWTAPAGRGHDQLVHEMEGQRLMAVMNQERVLPADVVNDEVEERAQQMADKLGRPTNKDDKKKLKEEVTEELLAVSHVRKKMTRLWWDVRRQRIVVEATSAKKADDVLNFLRETLGSLKVLPLTTVMQPPKAMTEWLKDADSRPDWLTMGHETELKDPSDQSTYTAKKVDLDADETNTLLDAGRTVTRLGFRSEGYLEAVLTDGLVLKGIKYDDTVKEQANQDGANADDDVGKLEADFIILTGALAAVISDVIESLGGLAKAPTADEKIAKAEAETEAE